MTKKYSIIASTFPERLGGASATVFYLYLKKIIESGAEVKLYVMEDTPSLKINFLKQDLGANIDVINLIPSKIIPKNNLELFNLAFNSYFSKNKFHIDEDSILICFDIFTALYARNIECKKKIVWLGDLLFEVEWYGFLEGIKYNKLKLAKLPIKIITTLIKIFPYYLLRNKFTKIISCSKISQVRLKKLAIASVFIPFPYLGTIAKFSHKISNTFLFYGNLAGTGSYSGLCFLIYELLPLISTKLDGQNYKILIAGRTALPISLENKLRGFPQIEFIGKIKDLSDIFSKVAAVLVPISIPLGNRTRVIDALSAGVPMIGHPNLALGNPYLEHDKNCLFASDADQFLKYMIEVNLYPDKFTELSFEGRAVYENYFSIENDHLKAFNE